MYVNFQKASETLAAIDECFQWLNPQLNPYASNAEWYKQSEDLSHRIVSIIIGTKDRLFGKKSGNFRIF